MTTVANFDIQYTQFLSQQGEPTRPLPEFARDAELIPLYRAMVLIMLRTRSRAHGEYY